MKTFLPILTLLFVALFATSSVQANTPFNAKGIIVNHQNGNYLFKTDEGKDYYVWTDQGKEELGPFVDKRVAVKGNAKTTPQGLDFIAWVASVRTVE